MDEKIKSETEIPKRLGFFSTYGLIVSILIGAWIIGMAIVVAGLIISKELRRPTQEQILQSALNTAQKVDIRLADNAPSLGNKGAKVTVVEYADYQCPFCEQFFKETLPQLKTKYIDTGKIRFVRQDFEFLGEESQMAAEAAKCSGDQGKYWEYHDVLYQNQKAENSGGFAAVNLKKFAKNLQLDINKFNTCFDSRAKQQEVTDEFQQGSGYGVNATPTVFINGVKFEGVQPVAIYERAIEAALK